MLVLGDLIGLVGIAVEFVERQRRCAVLFEGCLLLLVADLDLAGANGRFDLLTGVVELVVAFECRVADRIGRGTLATGQVDADIGVDALVFLDAIKVLVRERLGGGLPS